MAVSAGPAQTSVDGTSTTLLPSPPTKPIRFTAIADTARVLARNELRTSKASLVSSQPWQGAIRLLGAAGRDGGPPILLLLVAFAFLAAQDRIDRNDPKLALAPVHGHQELMFTPIDRGTP